MFPDHAGRLAALSLALDDFPANNSNTVLGQPRGGLTAQQPATNLTYSTVRDEEEYRSGTPTLKYTVYYNFYQVKQQNLKSLRFPPSKRTTEF